MSQTIHKSDEHKPLSPLLAFRQWLREPLVSSFVAGGVAGAVSRTVVSPFERMKIIFQVQGPGNGQYQGLMPTLIKMWKEEGWRGFFRGNGVNCIRIVPYSAVQFSSYSFYKSIFVYESVDENYLRLLSGALAGITSVVATYPLDIVRTRLSIQTADIGKHNLTTKPPGMWPTMKNIYRTEGGIRGLYRGNIPTIMGVAPYVGINFAVYEYIRAAIVGNDPDVTPTALQKLGSGAISGAIAQTLTYPFDVLRRRFQVVSMGQGELGYQYNSVWHAVKSIIISEGITGLYKGLSANLLKVAPSMAAQWYSFEVCKELLTK